MELTADQVTSLRIINIFICLLFVGNLIFILHNICRYIIRLKICQTLIISFYVMVILATSFRIVEISAKIRDPSSGFFPMERYIEILMTCALFFMIGTGLTLIVTMHQLSLTLKTISSQKNPPQTK